MPSDGVRACIPYSRSTDDDVVVARGCTQGTVAITYSDDCGSCNDGPDRRTYTGRPKNSGRRTYLSLPDKSSREALWRCPSDAKSGHVKKFEVGCTGPTGPISPENALAYIQYLPHTHSLRRTRAPLSFSPKLTWQHLGNTRGKFSGRMRHSAHPKFLKQGSGASQSQQSCSIPVGDSSTISPSVHNESKAFLETIATC